MAHVFLFWQKFRRIIPAGKWKSGGACGIIFPMSKYAEIIVDIAHSNVDHKFDYAIPPGREVSLGSRVRVPFGRLRSQGYVIGLKDATEWDEAKIRPIEAVVDDFPVVTEEQLRLAEYIRREYHTTMTFAIRLMFPAALRAERIRAKKIRMIALANRARAEELRTACFTKSGVLRAKNRLKTIDTLLAGDAPSAVLDGPSVRYLLEAGAAREYFAEGLRAPYEAMAAGKAEEFSLTAEQQAAVQTLCALIDRGEKQTALLHGVTGSGKTEVYVRLIDYTLRQGKTAMLLVPEIALAPQLYRVIRSRFGDLAAVFHSGLSDGERFDEWRRVRTGQAKIVMGARSAVFLPAERLGLIILDEEHSESYKSENHPPYHAAEIGRIRAHMNGALLVLASATPRIESYFKAKLGIYQLVELRERVNGLRLPRMEIVDMKREFVLGNRSILSGRLHDALAETLARGEQAILFLNKRGYAASVLCPTCGHVKMCTRCDVPLKYHKSQNALVCHYCGRTFPMSRVCENCGEPFAVLTGAGTEQVAEQVERFFPQARILRMDFDTTRAKDAHQRIYEDFRDGRADVLIGTQMVARGLDFDNVTLAAIVSADSLLNFGGYRAAENTFSMIEQVGGRAGRKKAGTVIVQTYQPEHYAIQYAAAHDYQGFFDEEIRFRRATEKPPFARLFRLLISSRDGARAEVVCQEGEAMLREALARDGEDVLLFTAGAAPVSMLDGQHRYHILVKVRHNKHTRAIREKLYTVWGALMKRGVTVGFDTDPYDIN